MRCASSGHGVTRGPALCAAVLAVVMLVSGCVSDGAVDPEPEDGTVNPENGDAGDGEEDEENGRQVLATSLSTSTGIGSQLQFEIYALDRMPDGRLVLEFGVANRSEESLHFFQAISESGDSAVASAVTLIDAGNMQRYLPLEYADETCFCRDWSGEQHLAAGDTLELWTVYPEPPAEVEELTVEFVQAPPLLDVPLGEAAEGPEPEGDLAEPRVLDLSAFSDDLGEGTGREDSGEETAIMLSTDVLFDVDESVLTDEAEDILEETAAEIDAAEGELIQIDGHADNTGTDAINDPLSEDRAEAVQQRLEELVTRSEVQYEAEGHGSHEPIADNATEEGREKNRRVTVTFTP